MTLLTREQILSAEDRGKFDVVSVPEWGGDVRLRVISGTDRYRFDVYRASRFPTEADDPGPKAYLAALTICDENGKPLFKPEDCKALGEKSDAALDRVFDAACRLNGIGTKAAKDAEKN